MTETEFLLWVRGPALQVASIIFILGIAARVLEILIIGRKTDLAEARGSAVAGGRRHRGDYHDRAGCRADTPPA